MEDSVFVQLAAELSADRVWARRLSRIVLLHRLRQIAGRGLGSVGSVTGTWGL